MKRYMKAHEAGWNTEEHGEFPALIEKNAIEPASRIRQSKADHDVASLDRRRVLMSVLKDTSGGGTVEHALVMTLGAMFLICGLLLLGL